MRKTGRDRKILCVSKRLHKKKIHKRAFVLAVVCETHRDLLLRLLLNSKNKSYIVLIFSYSNSVSEAIEFCLLCFVSLKEATVPPDDFLPRITYRMMKKREIRLK